MTKNLTNSQIDRQNILNNSYALSEIEKAFDLKSIIFEDRLRFTKEQVTTFYEMDVRTIERYLEENKEEFLDNGYEVLKGNRLKKFIDVFNVGTIQKTTSVS